MEEYTFEQKEKLSRRIKRLKKDKYFSDVQNIILKNNPNINITTTTSGTYMYFHNLTLTTYRELDNYIENVSKVKDENATIDSTIDSCNVTQIDDECFPLNPKLKYSNQEKNLIKRKNYAELLGSNNMTDQIFAKKNEK